MKWKNEIYNIDEINWVIFLVIMFAFRGMVIKMSKIAHIFVFSADGGIKVVTVRAKHLTAPENLLEFFQKMV